MTDFVPLTEEELREMQDTFPMYRANSLRDTALHLYAKLREAERELNSYEEFAKAENVRLREALETIVAVRASSVDSATQVRAMERLAREALERDK